MVVEAEGQPSSEAVAANWERPLAETVESGPGGTSTLRSKSRSNRLLQLTRFVDGANLDHKYRFQ